MSEKISWREATLSDAGLILNYIKALAIEESFPYPVAVKLSDIQMNLLGDGAPAKAKLILLDGKTCGFIVYYFTFATTTGQKGLHLDDFYIEPEFQGNGIGKWVMYQLARLAKSQNCARFEWWSVKVNQQAMSFYNKLGATELDELALFRLDKDSIEQLAGKEI